MLVIRNATHSLETKTLCLISIHISDLVHIAFLFSALQCFNFTYLGRIAEHDLPATSHEKLDNSIVSPKQNSINFIMEKILGHL